MRQQDNTVYISAGYNAYHIGSTLFGQITLGDNPYREEPARKLWTKGFTDARNKLAPKPIFKKVINGEEKRTARPGARPGGNSKVLHKWVEIRKSGNNSPTRPHSGYSSFRSSSQGTQGK